MAGSIILTVAGIVMIGLIIFDVFMTVLHPQAESPFSSRLQTGVWTVLRFLARVLRGRKRHRFLGLAVPLMIVLLIATWVLILLVAFGLIYAAWIDYPAAFRGPTDAEHTWVDALYFSGVTLGTIGYGDFQPVHPLLRFAAIVEGFSGIGVISMSIAYVLELYPVFQRQRVLAVLLNEETAGQASGLPMLTRYLRSNKFEPLADLLRVVNLELLFLAEAHRRLPVLHYAHPTEVEGSFLRILIVVRNLIGALRYGMVTGPGKEWSEDPRVRDVEDSFFYTLYTLGSSFNLTLANLDALDEGDDAITNEFKVLAERLTSLRLPSVGTGNGDNETSPEYNLAFRRYLRFVQSSEPALLSYQRNSGYRMPEATQNAARNQRLLVQLETEQGQEHLAPDGD